MKTHNNRVGLWVGLAMLTMLLSVGLSSTSTFASLAAPAPGGVTVPITQAESESNNPLPPIDCSRIKEYHIDMQENPEADRIMNACSGKALPEGGINPASALTSPLAGTKDKAPDATKDKAPKPDRPNAPEYGTVDLNIISGAQNAPHVTQNDPMVWADDDSGTIVVNYNDTTDAPNNYTGLSVGTIAGFTRIRPAPLTLANVRNLGQGIVVYNKKLARWFAGDLVRDNRPGSPCGSQGIALWNSNNPGGPAGSWVGPTCVHRGSADDHDSMWVDNNIDSKSYGWMWISYNDFSIGGGSLWVTRSTTGGATWDPPVMLNSGSPFIRNVRIVGALDIGTPVTPNTVFVSAINENGGLALSNHYMYRSTDGGLTWSRTTVAALQPPPGNSTCATNSFFPKIATIWRQSGYGQPYAGPCHTVFYAYARHGAGSDAGDIYFVRSTDDGVHWSAPQRMDTDPGTTSFHEQWMPSVSITKQGAVTVSWYDRRNSSNGTNYEYRARVSTDNGATFPNPDQQVGDVLIPQPLPPEANPTNVNSCYAGDYNADYADYFNSYMTWTDGRNLINGSPQQDIYFDWIPFPSTHPKRSITVLKLDAESNEPIQGVTICLYSGPNGCLGNLIACYQTNANGLVDFMNLDPGSYSIGELVPQGWIPVPPAPCDSSINITNIMLDGSHASMTQPASASGSKAHLVSASGDTVQIVSTAGNDHADGDMMHSMSKSALQPLDTATSTNTPTSTRTSTPTITSTFTPVPPCNYSIAPSAGATIVPGTTDIGNHTDDGLTTITLPFTYNLYDQSFTTAQISSNGQLDFLTGDSNYSNSCLPDAAASYAIFAYWNDQLTNGVGGGIFTSVSGSAPNRIFNIEWRSCVYNSGVCAASLNYEVRLYEGQSRFDVIYATLDQATNGGAATVGVQKATGSLFTQFECNTANSLNNGLLLVFSLAPCPTNTATNTPTSTITGTPPTLTPTRTYTNTPISTPTPCGAANGDYVITPMNDSSIDPTNKVLVAGSQCDDCTSAIALPFSYSLYGSAFTSVNASSNGNLQFSSADSTYNNTCVPVAALNNAIFAHWDDLRTDVTPTLGIYTAVMGSAPNRTFNIEWRAVYSDNASAVANFEVRLYEGQDKFDIVYDAVDQGGSGATVGVQRGTGSQYTQYECNTASTLGPSLLLSFAQKSCNTPTPINTYTATPTETPTEIPTYPFGGYDSYDSGGMITLQLTGVGTDTVTLNGPIIMLHGNPCSGCGPGGSDTITTTILSMTSTGQSTLFGSVEVSQSPFTPTLGEITQQTPGVDFPSDDFYDLFVNIQTDQGVVHNDQPIRLQAAISEIPAIETSYTPLASLQIPLLNSVGAPVGILTYMQNLPLKPCEILEIFRNLPPCTPRVVTLPVGGVADNFSTANGLEPASPSAAQIAYKPATVHQNFDDTRIDGLFMHTFSVQPLPRRFPCTATLEIRLKPLSDQTLENNDEIKLGGNPGFEYYQRLIKDFLGVGDSWLFGHAAVTLVINLNTLAEWPALQQQLINNGFLSVTVDDDTEVDYVKLTVGYCCGTAPACPFACNINIISYQAYCSHPGTYGSMDITNKSPCPQSITWRMDLQSRGVLGNFWFTFATASGTTTLTGASVTTIYHTFHVPTFGKGYRIVFYTFGPGTCNKYVISSFFYSCPSGLLDGQNDALDYVCNVPDVPNAANAADAHDKVMNLGSDYSGEASRSEIDMSEVNGSSPEGVADKQMSNTQSMPVVTLTDTPTNTPTSTITPTDTDTNTPTPRATVCGPGGDYSVNQSSGAAIVPGTTDIENYCDDCTTTITLPFSYTLYDRTFTSVNVSSNGNLQFASNDEMQKNNCLPNPALNYAILPYWDDLRTDITDIVEGDGIFTSVSGSAPNRIFNIEWHASYYNDGAPVNFEVRLYEGQTRFDFIYGNLGGRSGETATIGVQKDADSRVTQFTCGTGWLSPGTMLSFTTVSCSPPPPCGPDANYTMSQSSGASIVPGTTDIGNYCDDCTTTITLPFAYTLYDNTFNTVDVSSNGNLQFGSKSEEYLNECLPNADLNNAILANWDDLRTDVPGTVPSGIFTSVSGSAPNRIFNIEWRAVYYTSTLTSGTPVNFEAQLYEGQKRFDVIYGAHGTGDPEDNGVTVGVQKGTGSRFTQYTCNTSSPPDGLRLTFSQPSCTLQSVIHGHLTWQGVNIPTNRSNVTGTLTLCVSGASQSFGPFNTDTSGNFTITTELPDGTYNWTVRGGRHVSNASPLDGAALVIAGGNATQEFGTQKGGNTDSNNIINASDFTTLRNQFGQGGVKAADADYNLVVNSLDFNILKGNFGQAGHAITCP